MPRTLIIPPTMAGLPDTDVPPAWPPNRYRGPLMTLGNRHYDEVTGKAGCLRSNSTPCSGYFFKIFLVRVLADRRAAALGLSFLPGGINMKVRTKTFASISL
jgi:hypothetical protein